VAAAILAGGQGRRLGGVQKPLLEVGGRTVLERTVAAVAPLAGALFLVGDPALLGGLGHRVVADRRPGQGPLAGLEAALAESPAETLLLLGGDMPFLTTALLERLLGEAPGADVVCMAGERGLEPLCARYHRRLLGQVTALLDGGERSVQALLEALAGSAALAALPPRDARERLALTNLNTADDLARARALAAAGEPA
jgi:molybdopterin-guanine dinucleotide biosynthesis protein A